MLVHGFLLGLITFLGWSIAFSQMPQAMQKFFARHNFITDSIVICSTYFTLGGQLISLFAAAFVGIFFEIYTYILRNEEEFEWLFEMIQDGKQQLKDMVSSMKNHMQNRTVTGQVNG